MIYDESGKHKSIYLSPPPPPLRGSGSSRLHCEQLRQVQGLRSGTESRKEFTFHSTDLCPSKFHWLRATSKTT
ncbi:hypothetical protein MDA_GLEAN10015921 [Myotis davidii]|uniref:Uncharacterized protein n=1 Tax=Myotis davidii TaxID=225400 RepID=L5MEQ1_MYODS|nr:hypothetical protein MDA_GLEAN10015921 [Myotis davidii]